MSETMTGAEMVIRALQDQGVEHVFGYPGGAVLPIYDALFHQDTIKHILVRHEQGAVHAAEGYARSSGKVGVVLVTSGPGATNAVTGLDRRHDGFGAARLPDRAGADPPDRLRRLPGMRHGRHHAPLHQAQLPREDDRGAAAHPARGLLRRRQRPARPGRGRPAEGHPVQGRALRAAARQPAQDLPADGQGRPEQDRRRGRADGRARAPALLHRRRRHQFRPARGRRCCASSCASPAFPSPRR